MAAPSRTPAIAAAAAVATGAAVGLGAAASPAQLLLAAAAPVAKIAMYCAVGALAASRGLLNAEGRRLLSGLSLHVFTPCLMFSKLAAGCGLGELARCWPLSANMVVSHVVGLLLGLLAVRLAAVPPRLRPHVVLCCGMGNVGNLPFVLLAGLAADPRLPFAAALGPAAAEQLAMRYVALSNLSAALIQFPLTQVFLQKPPRGTEEQTQGQRQQQQQPPPPPPPPQRQELPAGTAGNGPPPPPPPPQTAQTPDAVASAPAPAAAAPMWRSLAAGLLSPPTVASLLGVAVASVGWLQDALFAPGGCLRLLGEVADGLGAACIPLLLLVLGANLAAGPGVAAGRLPAAAAAAAVAARLLVLPGLCGAALLGAAGAGLLPGTDPLALLVMLLMHATPTAVLVHSMATLHRNAEDEVAALLFVQYAASLLTLPAAIGAMLAMLAPAAAAPGAWAAVAVAGGGGGAAG